jgi:hypothetical protein
MKKAGGDRPLISRVEGSAKWAARGRGSAVAGWAVPVGLNPDQRRLMLGFLARIAEGMANGLGQPAAETTQAAHHSSIHGLSSNGYLTLIAPLAWGNQ